MTLAVSLVFTDIAVPVSGAEASEYAEQISQADMETGSMELEDMESGTMDPAVEDVELPKQDGEYVIYMENDQTDEVSFADEAYEITANSQEVILETDLSDEQIDQLEELSVSDAEVYIEENIYLTGASDTSSVIPYADGAADEETNDGMTAGEENENGNKEDSAGEDDNEDADDQKRLEFKRKLVRQMCEADDETEAEWNVQMIHADDAKPEIVGETVKVAVLDSGVEFLADIPIEKSINFVKSEQDMPYYINDMTGHGTAVADIIHQVCPQAQIYSVKVMDSENRGRLSDVVAGIYWCMEQDVDIINMSFGTSVESDILRKAVAAASEQGIMMISSAGNGGAGSEVEYPAAFEEVIAVGAVDTSAQKTESSTIGEEVELVAPGEQILTKSMLGLETVNSGTSMAAPHVTGAAAVLMQQSEYKDAAFIRRVLDKSSNPLGDENSYGYGLLDVAYAKNLLSEYEEIMEKEVETSDDGENEAGGADIDEMTMGEAAQNKHEEPETDIGADVIDSLEQVSRPVETFEEVDYVEGRWESGDHSVLAGINCDEVNDLQEDGFNGFTGTEIKIFKAGAAYPGQQISELDNHDSFPEWHGKVKENYIANFIFATRIAKAGGNTANLKKVKGQSDATYSRMKSTISEKKVNGRLWKDILGNWNYGSQNDSTKKTWRQVFLYGMSLHSATDVFSHASYYADESGKKVHITGNSAKDRNYYPNRWKCAKNTAYYAAINCSEKITGDIEDFSSWNRNYWKGFYIGNILKYANAVDGGEDPEWMQECFEAVNFTIS